MIGHHSSEPGRPPEVKDRELLNVIRRAENKEVPTPDIEDADGITIEIEAVRQRLNQLESEGRVESRTVGSMRLWRLGELEADEPVRNQAMETAHRRANMLTSLGKTYLYLAVGGLFTAITFFILFLHGNAGQINPPILTEQQLLLGGYLFGYGGALFGVAFGLFYAVGLVWPKATAWWLNRNPTEQSVDTDS